MGFRSPSTTRPTAVTVLWAKAAAASITKASGPRARGFMGRRSTSSVQAEGPADAAQQVLLVPVGLDHVVAVAEGGVEDPALALLAGPGQGEVAGLTGVRVLVHGEQRMDPRL